MNEIVNEPVKGNGMTRDQTAQIGDFAILVPLVNKLLKTLPCYFNRYLMAPDDSMRAPKDNYSASTSVHDAWNHMQTFTTNDDVVLRYIDSLLTDPDPREIAEHKKALILVCV